MRDAFKRRSEGAAAVEFHVAGTVLP